MEDKTRALIVTGAVLLLILALIIAAIFYLIRFIQGRTTTRVSASPSPQITVTPAPVVNNDQQITEQPTDSNQKTYNGVGFQLTYPKNWGILTCSNSQNIEFDPANGVDQLRVACDYAQKPVTVMVGVSCEGATTQIGGMQVVKSQRALSKGTEYSWCVKTGGNNLLFTNRVSTEDTRGYGKDNQSQAIEQIISRIRIGQAS